MSRYATNAPTTNAHVAENIAAPVCAAIRDYYRGDFASAVNRLMPLRYEYQPIGGSHAQRDVFNIYLVDAAIKAQQLPLAKSLLQERVSLHQNSYGTWQKLAGVCDSLDDVATAKQARSEAARVAAAPWPK